MDTLLSNFKISVNPDIYLKDPESSELGRKIINHSIALIDELGFEQFTFKKLGVSIASNESSIYRYFENKHMLLLYLSSWYWTWVEYKIVINTYSVDDASEKLKKAITIISNEIKEDSDFSHINEIKLHRIIINENSKSFLTKKVDTENQKGYFEVYKRIVYRLKEMIMSVNPEYNFTASLASTVIESAFHQHFLKDHFPSLTASDTINKTPEFIIDLVFKTLNTTYTCKN